MKRNCILIIYILISTFCSAQNKEAEEWKKRGNAASDSADYDKAIEYYMKAIKIDSNYFDAYHNLGLSYTNKQDYDKAIEFYNKALTLNDKDAVTYFALGLVYAYKQNYDKAIESFKKGVALKPNSPEEYGYLSYLYQEKGNPVYSIVYAKKAAQLGDTAMQQFLTDNELTWEDNFLKPDYEQIEKNITDKSSSLYYDKLWERFQRGDSTMTVEEKRHLYYGYVFNKNYNPYRSIPAYDKIKEILNKEEPSKEEWEELISLIDEVLHIEPFNCRHLYYQLTAYQMLGKQKEADKNDQKIHCVFDAMLSTGDALTKETAIHVIAVPNEYDYMFFNNLSMKGQALVKGGFDVLDLEPNMDGLDEIWFDVNQSLNALNIKDK